MGLRDIETKINQSRAWEKKRLDMLLDDLEDILENRNNVVSRLAIFERKYSNQLSSFPLILSKIKEVKNSYGIPERIDVTSIEEREINEIKKEIAQKEQIQIPKHPSILERASGRGPFYSHLSLKLLEIGQRIIKESGGLIKLSDLVLMINKERSYDSQISLKDIERSLRRLQKDKLIPGLNQLSSGIWIVEFTPILLERDIGSILEVAHDKGYTTIEEVVLQKKWTPERVIRSMAALEKMGVARLDKSYRLGKRYFFPGLKIEEAKL
ncbi:MAG: hypothetical protein ACTSUV_03725 [Candidatus Ranarchaeia archaeon]